MSLILQVLLDGPAAEIKSGDTDPPPVLPSLESCTDPDRAGVPGSFSPSVLRFSAVFSALFWSEASSPSLTGEGL